MNIVLSAGLVVSGGLSEFWIFVVPRAGKLATKAAHIRALTMPQLVWVATVHLRITPRNDVHGTSAVSGSHIPEGNSCSATWSTGLAS